MKPYASTLTISVGVAALTIGLSACGSSSSGDSSARAAAGSAPTALGGSTPMPDATPASTALIKIHGFVYTTPASVSPGATVTVRNTDGITHTVTADASDSVFNLTIEPGATKSFQAPNKPGSYPFHCTFHSNMHGDLVVK